MNNKESHYYKLFRYITIVILLVLTISGILLVSMCYALFKNSSLKDIKNTGDFYAECVAEGYGKNDFLEYADDIRETIMANHDISIYLYDKDDVCISSEYGRTGYIDEKIRLGIENNSEILELSSSSLSHNAPNMVYGKKIYLNQDDFLYVVIYGRTTSLDKFTVNITLIYVSIALVSLLVLYALIKRRFKNHIAFEEDMLRIIEKYTKGDFSEKLSTDISPNMKHISERINALALKVEKSEETSSTFIANVSHELRTPITTIGGFVDGILDGTIKKSRQQEYLVLVSQEIQRLRILITSMLNMSKFESGTMTPNFTETNLTELVIKVVLMFEKRIEEKQLEVEELDSNRIMAVVDPDLMQQVIYNLVENAVKFVNKGGTLSFTFTKKDNICIIGIKNTGEGLKDSEIQQVFNRFYKTDSSRGKDKTGLGLGLSISRKIVHLHNGHIVVKSVYGEYTEFQIQIPEDPRLVTKEKKEK